MIIDGHHHVWTLARGDYDWPTPDLAIYRDYGLDDLRAVCGEVRGSVLVQATPTVAETAFLLQVAASSHGLVQGVVGWTDLAAADAVARITALAATPMLVGLRTMLQDMPENDRILDPAVAPALQAMAEAGLPLDLLIRAPQLTVIPRLGETFPALRMVIDHAAKPPIAAGRWQPWADDIARAAINPNVVCKLSGLVTEAPDWSVESLQPTVDHLLCCFGPERLMWGSDWPVVDLAGGYGRWMTATKALLGGRSTTEHSAIFGKTAARFYQLPGANAKG